MQKFLNVLTTIQLEGNSVIYSTVTQNSWKTIHVKFFYVCISNIFVSSISVSSIFVFYSLGLSNAY